MTAHEGLAAVLAELALAANSLSTARYLLPDPATAAAATADGRTHTMAQLLADHLAELSADIGQEPAMIDKTLIRLEPKLEYIRRRSSQRSH